MSTDPALGDNCTKCGLPLDYVAVEQNETVCSTCYLSIAEQAEETEPERRLEGDLSGVRQSDLTDDHNRNVPLGEVFAGDQLVGKFLYVPGFGWHRWSGHHWLDLEAAGARIVTAVANAWVPEYIKQLRELGFDDDADEVGKYRDIAQVRGLVDAASHATGILVHHRDLDADEHLLNTPSGIVDLRTGDLSASDPTKLMTKTTGVNYTADLTDPDWSAALTAVDPEVQDFLQDRFGQALFAAMPPSDEVLVLHGHGSNGKSTLVGTAARAFGDYAVVVPDRVLTAGVDAHTTEMTELRGRRLGWLEETPESRRLNSVKLKKLTSSPISARRMRQDSVTFENVTTTIMNTNYLPAVDESDHGTWRRLVAVPFTRTYRTSPKEGELGKDEDLRPRLAMPRSAGQGAALAWAVAGAVAFYGRGQRFAATPTAVQEATREWRESSDSIALHFADRLVLDPKGVVWVQDLLADLNEWLELSGLATWGAKLLESRFTGHEVLQGRVRKFRRRVAVGDLSRPVNVFGLKPVPPPQVAVNVWAGVRFRTPNDELDEGS